MALSGIVSLVTIAFVFPIVAFRVSWWWGLLCFVFAGPATIIFSILHFQRAKVPSLVAVVSGVVAVGVLLMRSFMAAFFLAPQ